MLPVLFLMDISLGSVWIPLSETLRVLSGEEAEKTTWGIILLQFRLPRACTALLVGSGLGVSGILMQTLFRNPMAGPFVLGISSGASLGVALIVLTMGTLSGIAAYTLSTWTIVLAGSTGAALVLVMVVSVSAKIRDSMSLLIIGLMFASVTGAIVSVLQFFSTAEQIQQYLVWTFGSLGALDWEELALFSPVVFLGLLVSYAHIKPLNALLLGERYAESIGIRMSRVRLGIIGATSLLAGSITAFCGPIAFVGLAVPHLIRLLFNTSDHRLLLPAIALGGANIMLFCDMLAQLPGSEQRLPINAVTALFGAPVVIWLVVRKRNIGNTL